MERKEMINKMFMFMMNANNDELKSAFKYAANAQGLRDEYFWNRYWDDAKYTKCQEVSIMKEFRAMADVSQKAFVDYIFENFKY